MTLHFQNSLRNLLAAAIVALSLAGCPQKPEAPSSASRAAEASPEPATPVVGGDRDAHGCIASAGYSWCARKQECVRVWELAKDVGIENTAEAIAGYCATPEAPAAGTNGG